MITIEDVRKAIYGKSSEIAKKLTDDLAVDRYDLVGEWERQHQIYMDWVNIYALSVMERDTRKSAVELSTANLDSLIRSDPSAYGVDKVTESAVKNAIISSEEYQEKITELHKANLFMHKMEGAKTAFEQRKKALENLVQLSLAGFYSANSAPAESHIKKSTDTRRRLAEKMKSKNKA